MTLSIRVKEPEEKTELRIGDISEKSLRVVKPSEMVKVILTAKELHNIGMSDEIEVACEKEAGKE